MGLERCHRCDWCLNACEGDMPATWQETIDGTMLCRWCWEARSKSLCDVETSRRAGASRVVYSADFWAVKGIAP